MQALKGINSYLLRGERGLRQTGMGVAVTMNDVPLELLSLLQRGEKEKACVGEYCTLICNGFLTYAKLHEVNSCSTQKAQIQTSSFSK